MTSIGTVLRVYAPARTQTRRPVKKPRVSNGLGDNLRPLHGASLATGLHENPAQACQIETGAHSGSLERGMGSPIVAQVLGQILPSSSDAARIMRAYAESKGCDPDIRFVRFL
jgi:hypothetical protein